MAAEKSSKWQTLVLPTFKLERSGGCRGSAGVAEPRHGAPLCDPREVLGVCYDTGGGSYLQTGEKLGIGVQACALQAGSRPSRTLSVHIQN